MDTNINHLNSRKEYMELVYHNSSPFDFLGRSEKISQGT